MAMILLLVVLLGFPSCGIAQTCLAEWQQCYVNPSQNASAPCNYVATNGGTGCCVQRCCSGLVCGGTSSDSQWWAACHAPSAVTAGQFSPSACNSGSTTTPATTKAPTTAAPTTTKPTTGAPTTTKPITLAPTTTKPTTLAPATTNSGTTKLLYCPSANDLVVGYGSASLVNQGWTINGGGAAATKSSFNLINGWVSYTANFNGVPVGVNANIYSVAPSFVGSFTNSAYCDGQPATSTKPWCVEADWIESNGNCGGASTLHTYNVADNTGGCGGWGCTTNYVYNGVSSFVMNVSYDSIGRWSVSWNGNSIGSLNPAAGSVDWSNLLDATQVRGQVIYSSQWVGWVPTVGSCNTASGNLNAAQFSISNLKIYGSVVQGPTPTRCS